MKILIGITGASGIGYALDLLTTLDGMDDMEISLILSNSAIHVELILHLTIHYT